MGRFETGSKEVKKLTRELQSILESEPAIKMVEEPYNV